MIYIFSNAEYCDHAWDASPQHRKNQHEPLWYSVALKAHQSSNFHKLVRVKKANTHEYYPIPVGHIRHFAPMRDVWLLIPTFIHPFIQYGPFARMWLGLIRLKLNFATGIYFTNKLRICSYILLTSISPCLTTFSISGLSRFICNACFYFLLL